MNTIYTAKDTGCYIDGAFGEEHRRAKLASLVNSVVVNISHPGEMQTGIDLITKLQREPSDDLEEEYDAVSYLQDHTESGAYWTFDAGGLLLVCGEHDLKSHPARR